MDILAKLKSGQLHAAARRARPECVDADGNIHIDAKRARFVDWLAVMKRELGDDVAQWPAHARAKYERRYVPSH